MTAIADVTRVIYAWEPEDRPIHCANCANCVVFGSAEEPRVRCSRGHGTVGSLALVQVIRRKAPRQFVPAERCEDFDSMSAEPRP
jgi:hypothetical protein